MRLRHSSACMLRALLRRSLILACGAIGGGILACWAGMSDLRSDTADFRYEQMAERVGLLVRILNATPGPERTALANAASGGGLDVALGEHGALEVSPDATLALEVSVRVASGNSVKGAGVSASCPLDAVVPELDPWRTHEPACAAVDVVLTDGTPLRVAFADNLAMARPGAFALAKHQAGIAAAALAGALSLLLAAYIWRGAERRMARTGRRNRRLAAAGGVAKG
ncbi:hypothetical protein WG78_10325 [Amantichitinum ursilacus]|uniref:Uncharacterized protein n=2 Tax=Amantichitinum ursilacus TaxID=857265 RepID=A0A0N1JSS0_9NEIS|nr:hypothetical protein WG78_10325 [Amantichitinum ursilacus]